MNDASIEDRAAGIAERTEAAVGSMAADAGDKMETLASQVSAAPNAPMARPASRCVER